MKSIIVRWVVAAGLAGCAAHAMTGDSVAEQFRGDWVPSSAACASPLKVVIGPTVVTFVNGPERKEYKQLEQCFTCMGHDVENITMLSTDAMGDSPWTIYLDASGAKPAVRVDFSNDKKLAALFPIGTTNLKKCP